MTTLKRRIDQPRDTATRTMRIAYTPDSDDAFNYYAWEHGRIALAGFEARFERAPITNLNDAAAAGVYDVVGVSSAMFPTLADRYWILAVGNSIGRGYGPVLVAREACRPQDLEGRRVGVSGICTTGGALAQMFCPGATFVRCPYERIADAVACGELDAGVMIHEELLFYPQKGLHKVCDLGAAWCADTGLPLPVGLNLIKRSLGLALARRVARTCAASLRWGQAHFDEAFAFASRFGRGCAADHVAMFSNDDTLCLPPDAREALGVMFERIANLGLGPRLERWEIIDA